MLASPPLTETANREPCRTSPAPDKRRHRQLLLVEYLQLRLDELPQLLSLHTSSQAAPSDHARLCHWLLPTLSADACTRGRHTTCHRYARQLHTTKQQRSPRTQTKTPSARKIWAQPQGASTLHTNQSNQPTNNRQPTINQPLTDFTTATSMSFASHVTTKETIHKHPITPKAQPQPMSIERVEKPP